MGESWAAEGAGGRVLAWGEEGVNAGPAQHRKGPGLELVRNVSILSPGAQEAGLGGDTDLREHPCLEKPSQRTWVLG